MYLYTSLEFIISIVFHPAKEQKKPTQLLNHPEAPAEGEGANLDRRLVPYHGKCKRIQSRIELIYNIYIYLFIPSTAVYDVYSKAVIMKELLV